MSAWTADELARVGNTVELQLASRRSDGALRRFVTIWVVRAGDEIYVRSAYGPDSNWFRRARESARGRVRAGGIERDVVFDDPDESVTGAVTAAYHAKYDRYGPRIVGTVVSPDAERLTLRVSPV